MDFPSRMHAKNALQLGRQYITRSCCVGAWYTAALIMVGWLPDNKGQPPQCACPWSCPLQCCLAHSCPGTYSSSPVHQLAAGASCPVLSAQDASAVPCMYGSLLASPWLSAEHHCRRELAWGAASSSRLAYRPDCKSPPSIVAVKLKGCANCLGMSLGALKMAFHPFGPKLV